MVPGVCFLVWIEEVDKEAFCRLLPEASEDLELGLYPQILPCL